MLLKNPVTRILNAKSQLGSPAWPVKIDYDHVPVPDAVRELSVPTGDENLDFLHVILIGLLNDGFIYSVRRKDGTLGHVATELGRQQVAENNAAKEPSSGP